MVVGCSAGNAFLVHSGQISQVGPDGFSVRGINDAGTMAGCLDSHAYLLSSGGTLTQLPDLSPNGGGGNTPSSHAFGINNGNQIIGTSNNSQEFPRGDLERRNPHRPRALGGLSSVGEAINNLGQAVGYSATARGPTTRSSTTAAT